MFKGEFKTAYLQREIPENAIIAGDFVVGEMVKVTPAAGTIPAIVNKLTASTEVAALEEATNIFAQSDMTLGYGHVPVEDRDYRYSDKIKNTIADNIGTQIGAVYYGVFESESALKAAYKSPTADDTAMVINSAGTDIEKYVAKTSGSSVVWQKATSPAAYSIKLDAAIKHIATFKITNKDDVIVRDAG